MSDRKRDRSRSPGRGSYRRNGSDRQGDSRGYYGGGNSDGRRRSSGGREDPRDSRRRVMKQMLAQPAEPQFERGRDTPEEQAVELSRILSSRGYLDGGPETMDVATVLVEAAGSFSMQTSVYALTTALCMASAKSLKRGNSRDREERDGDAPREDTMTADNAIDPLDGPSFGRMVVDGCCHAFAKALQKGGFLRAKLLLRFLGELLNCGLVQAQEYGDMLTTLCASYVSTQHLHVKQPCRDIVTYMVLSAVLRVGPSLSKAWVGGFSDLMDDVRAFMAGRQAPFRLDGLRAIFVTPEDEADEDEKDDNDAAVGEDRPATQGAQPVEDSLMMLWDVVSGLHDNGWQEDDLPRAIPRLWKNSMVEAQLANLSSLSLPEDIVAAETIPTELTRMGACQLLAFSGVDGGSSSPADRPDWSYALSVMGERDLFDEDDGVGPASCCPELLPKKERVVLVEYCKDILACFQPVCHPDGTKVGRWTMLVDQLFSIRGVAPAECQPAYLIAEVLFLVMLQVPPAEHLALSCHRTMLELCRIVPAEAPAAVSYCTGRLFDELERLDSTVASRFGTWFADHLKNTEYKWPFWKHWCNVVELQPDNAQRLFVSNVLAALVKLSYTERIKKTLPEALWPLLPLDPTPVCPYLDEATGMPASLQRIAAELSNRIDARANCEDLQTWLDGDHELTAAQDASDSTETPIDPCWRSTMLIQILLRAGQASPTHTFVYLDRYREYLRALRGNEEAGEVNEVAMLDGVAQLWAHSPQWFCLVCQHLLQIGVLSPTFAVQYFFREDNNNAIALSPFLWEVVSRAISLYVDRVSQSVTVLQDLEEEEGAFRRRRNTNSPIEDDADCTPSIAPQDDDEKSASNKTRDQRDVVRESFDQARALCTATVSSFVQALANALPQYAANGIAVPGVPARYLSDEEDVSGSLFILRAEEVEVLASTAGCRAHVEGIITDLQEMA